MISRKKLDQLVAEFRSQQAGDSYEQQRADWWDQFTFEISPAWIDVLTEEEAQSLYKNTGWGVKLYQRTFQENGLERIRASLHYLLYSPDPIEDRFFNVVDQHGTHKLGGVGREFASFLLCMHDNQHYGIWNRHVDDGLKLLRMTPELMGTSSITTSSKGGSPGITSKALRDGS